MTTDSIAKFEIQVRGLRQCLEQTCVLDGIDLDIGTGVFGLLGPNGAGKTTFLRTLATVLLPTAGLVRLLGLDPADPRERRALRRHLGYLPQTLGCYPNFTIDEFVRYFALLKEMPVQGIPAAVTRAITFVGLEDCAHVKLKTLSGGMLRRVGIAQAIVNEPDLLLLDEPTAGLDPEQRVAFRALLREIGGRSTVVVSTHLVEDVRAVCGDVGVLSNGRLVFHGTPDRLTTLGKGHEAGDSSVERGYAAVLAGARP